MDLTSKKVQKNVIKLAFCVRKASKDDLILLSAMIQALHDKDENFFLECIDLRLKILDNPHLCALLGIKDNK